jgi:hypothetical protein
MDPNTRVFNLDPPTIQKGTKGNLSVYTYKLALLDPLI